MRAWLQRSLWDKVPRDHRESPERLRRRQLVTAVGLVLGAVVLGVSLRIEPGSPWFYIGSLGLSLLWAGAAFASGPLHLGRISGADGLRRPVLSPVLLAAGLVLVFVLGGLVVREVPFLDRQVTDVVAHAVPGAWPLVASITAVTGVAEELFFRGAAYAATPWRPVLVTTTLYTLATVATGNVMLTFAAGVLGLVVGLERRASGGILAPILTHVTWSLSMLVVLPALF
ncbi:MAG: type II CAAX endopeptidase family protein [Nocardioides sp.]